MSRFTVTEKAMRPASPERKCFYCTAPIGKNHWSNCVLVKKKVQIKVTLKYEIDVPAHWTPEQVKLHKRFEVIKDNVSEHFLDE